MKSHEQRPVAALDKHSEAHRVSVERACGAGASRTPHEPRRAPALTAPLARPRMRLAVPRRRRVRGRAADARTQGPERPAPRAPRACRSALSDRRKRLSSSGSPRQARSPVKATRPVAGSAAAVTSTDGSRSTPESWRGASVSKCAGVGGPLGGAWSRGHQPRAPPAVQACAAHRPLAMPQRCPSRRRRAGRSAVLRCPPCEQGLRPRAREPGVGAHLAQRDGDLKGVRRVRVPARAPRE